MNVFFKLLTAIGLGRLTLQVMAGNTEDNIRQQQDIQQCQREEQLRQTMQPESDVHLHQKNTGETVNQLMGDDSSQPCFAINEVVLEGEHHGRFQAVCFKQMRTTSI